MVNIINHRAESCCIPAVLRPLAQIFWVLPALKMERACKNSEIQPLPKNALIRFENISVVILGLDPRIH
ncbi:MAG: hypothetical protein DI595_19660 [Agrobacterium fabrum]|uniref:Uncharacterized protein n=1 Tax=Agrobacterium fabrum TaxID=1176649 RepID=A0A2W5EL59_9HYPH|nr:MAG: hypothetical protein DI595_19660 [Agrobacterium fabrum]